MFDGLQVGFVNVSTGNLTFERRDIVVPGRRRVVFSRIHDSRIRSNADFGPGWRLSLDEEIVVDGDAASYVDRSGARYGFRRGPDGTFVPNPMVPRLSGMRLAVAGETATLDAGDGGIRLFERSAAHDRWVLRRIEWPEGGWIGISQSDGRLATAFDGDGEMLRVERDAEGRIASVVDRHRRQVRYRYDRRGRLSKVRDLAGNVWSHEYHAANRLAAALGVEGEPYLRAGYDAAGRTAWSEGEAGFSFQYRPDRTVVSERTTGARHVFERSTDGVVVGFSSATGVAWRLRTDDSGRVETLGMSETAARLADDRPDAFRPNDAAPEDRELRGWARTIRFGHSRDGVAATETVSAAGRERRDYEYDAEGRLKSARSSTGGIPTLDVDYADVTALRTGWAGSDTVFEFHTAPEGVTMVGNGRTRIDIERDRRGAVAAVRGGARSVLFERDGLGRIEAARHVDGSAVRYFRDALGYRTLAEYGGGASRRVAVDASGDVVAFETADGPGRLATAATGVRVVELDEGWIARFGQLGVFTGDSPAASQPDYGAVRFGRDLAPRLDSPLRAGVAGLREALAMAPLAAGLLDGPAGSVRAAFDAPAGPMFGPPEYRGQDRLPLLSETLGVTVQSVPEVRVVGRRVPVAGFFTSSCIDDGWVYDTVEEACEWMVSYTRPAIGDLECTRCPTGGGGGGGGGGGIVPPPPPPPDPTVRIDSADVAQDSIVVVLEPAGSEGILEVALSGDANHTVSSATASGGTHTVSFNMDSVPNGAYTGISARWTVGTRSPSHTRQYSFKVLGDYRHSQYNTPDESACTGALAHGYVTNSQCVFTGTTFKSDFASQAYINGSGKSLNHGTIALEEWCLKNAEHPADADERSFRPGHTVAGTCGSVSESTVAVHPDNDDLSCGDSVYILGIGVKTVTDRCPGCTLTQLDNYTTTPACSKVYDLGTHKTIKL